MALPNGVSKAGKGKKKVAVPKTNLRDEDTLDEKLQAIVKSHCRSEDCNSLTHFTGPR